MMQLRRPKSLATILAGTVLLATFSWIPCAAGGTFFDDFESYSPGSNLHGQGGWKGWDNDPLVGAPASDAFAFSGNHSLEIAGDADLVHELNASGGQWTFTTQQYLPIDSTGTSWLIFLNRYLDQETEDPSYWSAQLVFDLDLGVVYGADFETEIPLVRDRWTEVRVEVDLDSNTHTSYYNDTVVASGAWYGADAAIAAVDFYAEGASSVYYDDVRLVPEPAGIRILLASGVSLLWCRRRTRSSERPRS